MDSDGLPLVGPGVDLSKVTAIHPKRMLAFLNHFIIHTTRFLNKFSCVCEQKLLNLNQRIQKLEVTMNILEAKLASIPGLENVTVSEPAAQPVSTDLPEMQPENQETDTALKVALEGPPAMTVSQDPRYIKFFKMITMGVPLEALKNKVRMEGLDPDLLETPDAPAPPMNAAGDSSESSFGSEDSDDDSSS